MTFEFLNYRDINCDINIDGYSIVLFCNERLHFLFNEVIGFQDGAEQSKSSEKGAGSDEKMTSAADILVKEETDTANSQQKQPSRRSLRLRG